MSGPVKDLEVARAIVAARIAHPELMPFASGVAPDDDRRSYLNASEAGRCARQLWYERSDTPREAESRPGIFDRGHAAEAWAVAYLGAAGLGQLAYAGDDQRRLVDRKLGLAGTPDGLLIRGKVETAVEIKSYGSTVDRSIAPSAANVAQTEMVIELFNRTTRHKPRDGLLVYLSTDNYTMLHCYRVPRRPAMWIEMVGKARDVLGAKDARDVVPSPGPLCGTCPFRTSCAAADLKNLPIGERLDETDVDHLDGAVRDYLQAIEARRQAEADELAHRADLRKVLHRLGLAKAARPDYVVRIFQEPGGKSLDEMALAAVLGDLEPYRRRGDPVEKIEVKGR
jgi:hypothetical protein